MKCPHCGVENSLDNDYCGRCGRRLAASNSDSNVPSWPLREREDVEEGNVRGETLSDRETPYINPASWSRAQRRRWRTWSEITVAFVATFMLFIAFITVDTYVRVLFIAMSVFCALVAVAVGYRAWADEKKLYG